MSGVSLSGALAGEHPPTDPTAPLTPSGNLRRRVRFNRFMEFGARGSAIIAIALLVIVVFEVVKEGLSAVTAHFPDFLFSNPGGATGGGIVNALLGTAVIAGFGALIAVPIGILTGIYLTEFAGPDSRSGRVLKLVLDLLQGLPTIIVGVFIFGLLVATTKLQSGFAGAVALSIVMLPLIARSSQEVLQLVPEHQREAADALGVDRWRTVRGVILPAAAGGIATGAILSIARAAGETAPLLFCDAIYDQAHTQLNLFGHGVPNIPIYIWTTYGTSFEISRVWGAALVLLTMILLANVLARVLLARSRAKMTA